WPRDWSSDVCSSDLDDIGDVVPRRLGHADLVAVAAVGVRPVRVVGVVLALGLVALFGRFGPEADDLGAVLQADLVAGVAGLAVRSEERRVGKGGRCR